MANRWTTSVIVQASEDGFAYTPREARRIVGVLRACPCSLHPLEDQRIIEEVTYAARWYRAGTALQASRPRSGKRGNPGKPALEEYIYDLDRISGLTLFPGAWWNSENGPVGSFSDFFRACAEPLMTPAELKQALGFARSWLKSRKYAKDRQKIEKWEHRDFVPPDGETVRRLFEENIGLAITIAKSYRGKGIPFDELKQAAFAGLVAAANQYDSGRGREFGAYAGKAIRGSIADTFPAWARVIPPPSLASEPEDDDGGRAFSRKVWSTIEPRGRRATTVRWASRDSDAWKTESRSEPDDLRRRFKVDREDPGPPTIYKDAELEGEETEEIVRVEDVGVSDLPVVPSLAEALDCLQTREREILVRHWGVLGHPAETNQQIGASLSISPARVGQIEKRALQKLGVALREARSTAPAPSNGPGWRWRFGSAEELRQAFEDYAADLLDLGREPQPDPDRPRSEELRQADAAFKQYRRNGEIDRAMRALLRGGSSALWWSLDVRYRRGSLKVGGKAERGPTDAVALLFYRMEDDLTQSPVT